VKKIISVLGLIGLMAPGLAGAASVFEKVGTFGAQFLKIGVGARASAMGGAFVAVSDDASALYWNCAGIARIDPAKSELSLNHAQWVSDLQFEQIGYVFHVKKIPGAFGVSARALTMEPMIETTAFQPDPNVGTGRTFDAGDMSLGVTYARSFTDKFSAGVTANFIHLGLAEFSQQTYSFDLGTLYDVGTLGMKIGMAISNIGGQVEFSGRNGSRPSSVSARRWPCSSRRTSSCSAPSSSRIRPTIPSASISAPSTLSTTICSCAAATTSTTTPRAWQAVWASTSRSRWPARPTSTTPTRT
jgi:hypothetical protein